MATPSEAMAVKSLNKSPGRRRFVFKSFSQRLEEIEIDVFRSLDPMKTEPSEGSSFFRDCLVQWRELNTAEDFISFYEEMMPWVQTLPQVLLHKEIIMSKLLSRLHMKARLSLEPILRLIVALSRDLLEDFLPFLGRISDSSVSLLKNGAEREPELLEQIFSSWSYIMMHLQKYLMQDIIHVLKVTVHLRYYPRDYVQEFMAEAISFLLRNASVEQLIRGIRKITIEAVKKPSYVRKFGVSVLLWNAMRGASSRFHSRAEQVLRLLMDKSMFSIGDKFARGSDIVVEVITATFQRLCEELQPKELILIWNCLLEELYSSLSDGYLLHLGCLLSILISAIQFSNRGKISDYQAIIELVGALLEAFIMPSGLVKVENHFPGIIDKVLLLMLCLLDGLSNCGDMSTVSRISLQWAPVFELRTSSLLTFVRELILRDPSLSYVFRSYIISAMDNLVEASPEEAIYLLLTFLERQRGNLQSSNYLDGTSAENSARLSRFIQEVVCHWTGVINDIKHGDSSSVQIDECKLSLLWGALNCYPHILSVQQEEPSLIMDLVKALDELLAMEVDNIAGVPKDTWQSIVGAALASYHRLYMGKDSELAETSRFLSLAKRHKSSLQVLLSVAEFLDSVHGSACEANIRPKIFHPEFEAKRTMDAVQNFSENLFHPNKGIRVSTLRILCYYEPLDCQLPINDQLGEEKLTTEGSERCSEDTWCSNVLQLLLLVESTPLSISTSRKVTLLISRIQMALSAERISKAYAPLLMNSFIGIFHNRFEHLWGPAQECLVVLISRCIGLLWDSFIHYLGKCQLAFLNSHHQLGKVNVESSNKSGDLVDCFNSFVAPTFDSTPCATVLYLLLQSLQKIPTIAESRSRQLVPLFLKFLGYNNDDVVSVEPFDLHACKGKEWRAILKEWLNLLKLMRNPKSLYRNNFLKEVLQTRLLDENDADIQMKVIDCLLNWKDDFLLPYDQHLKNLISSKNLREELATWSISKESQFIQEHHRMQLVPLVVRLLIPKVRKLKTLASRKHASLHHRKAVLCFLAQLEIEELPIFFTLLVKPFQPISNESGGSGNRVLRLCRNSFQEFEASSVLKYFIVDHLKFLSWKKKYGFLHVIEDIVRVFDEDHIAPFLNLLMVCVARMLESCTLGLDTAKINESYPVADLSSVDLAIDQTDGAQANHVVTSTAVKQLKDLRSLCLKIISFVLNKYEDHDFGCEFWDIFFMAVKPLIDSFKQEGSSSERPSSLFLCFGAMSRSHTLVSLLYREENLVSTIFSILTVKTASYDIKSYVLKFIENLLNLDNDLDSHEGSDIKRVLFPNLDALIYSLHCLFQCDKESERRLVKWPGKMELRILRLLSKYIKDHSTARKFADILLPCLAKNAKKSVDECVEALEVIRSIAPVLGSEITAKILDVVSPLLISSGLDMRSSICSLLKCLSEHDPSIAFLAKLIYELNAISDAEIGELDYDTRVSAYEKINLEFFHDVKVEHALVILSHCVYDMSSEELVLRQSASRLLLSFVQFSALILGHEANCDACWTNSCVQRIIKKFFLKHMGDAMCKEVSVQREWIALLREMVLKLPEVGVLNSLRALCSEDAEVDFFNNILHLQKHRRARALSRFRNAIKGGDVSESVIKRVFVPLFFNMLFDAQDGKGEHIKNACLETLASICGHMQWESYYGFLMRCFREMTLKPDKERVLLRLICSVLDQFHFSETCTSREAKNTDSEISSPRVIGVFSSNMPQRCDNSDKIIEIQTCLQKTVLPKLQKLLASDSEKINVTISLAVLKLLKLLPLETMESQLPSIIHRISNFLKNRLESVRDEARSVLAACAKELGVEYLQFIVRVLRATLKRGFELHVLGYTLNFILSKILSNSVVGKLDYCLEELFSVAENDILGDVSEEKEVEKIASKMKETRKRKSFETLKLIAQSITFRTHALKLVLPINSHLQKNLTPKMKAKLESMLNHIAAGIESNPSVDRTDLFVFAYGLIEDGITEETFQSKDSSTTKANKWRSNGVGYKHSSDKVINSESRSSHLITVFALGIIHNRLKNMKLDKKDEQLLSMLDPFIKLLGNCLSSKYEAVLSAALQCLTPLTRLPLSSLELHADMIKTFLFDIAQKSGTTSSPLMQSCLRLLTVLLRNTRITLSSDQLHILIQFPLFVDLERNPSSLALSLLKAIVGRKLVVHEIYDVVTRVAELMVTSQLEPIRKKCSQILLQFLLDYRLSEKRLQQHLDFLLANLSYEHSTGREAVLEMLHAILIKFPKSVIDGQAQTLFLHLVVSLANDPDNKVRSMIGAAIKLLIEHSSQNSLHAILEYSMSWYLGGKQHLWSAAAQVLGLLVEVLKKGSQRHINNLFPVLKRILKSTVDAAQDKQLDHSNDATIPLWKEAYYSLVMLEKILHQFPEFYFEECLEDVWQAVCKFQLHPHMWLRSISNRLVASYFATVTEAIRGDRDKLGTFLLMKPSRLFMIAVSLCCQLNAQLSDDAASGLIMQNLVFAICGVHSLAQESKSMDMHKFWSTIEQHEQVHFLEAFQLLGSKKGRSIFLSLTSGGSDQNNQESNEDLQSLLVSPLLKRMGKVALQMEDIQMKIVFNCFRMISSQIGQEDCQHYAIHMILPLYKVCEGFAGRVIADDVKQLAEEVRDCIRGVLGVESFVNVYNQIRKSLKVKRDKRKQEEKLMAVINPMRNAKRKLRIAAKHQAHKKRKIMTMKMGMGKWRS